MQNIKTIDVPKEEVQPPKITTCREAIQATWPSYLQDGAMLVLSKENGSEDPNAIGTLNVDGTQDFGCMMINNYWHANFFSSSDWRDPVANAAYAYKIYQGRGNWTAWYAVKGILY